MVLLTDRVFDVITYCNCLVKSFTDELLLDLAVGVVPEEVCVGKIEQFDAELGSVEVVIVRLSWSPGGKADPRVRGTPLPQISLVDVLTGRPIVQDLEPIHSRRSIGSSLKVLLQLLILFPAVNLEQLHLDAGAMSQGVKPRLLQKFRIKSLLRI